MLVRDWMSPDPQTVEPDADVGDVRALMSRYGIRHLPVVNRKGKVIGVLSDRDVRLDGAALRRASDKQVLEMVRQPQAVVEIMSSPPHVIGPDASVADAARLMLSRRISALPVVDADQVLLGMITSTDCLLALLSPDGPAGDESDSRSAVSR